MLTQLEQSFQYRTGRQKEEPKDVDKTHPGLGPYEVGIKYPPDTVGAVINRGGGLWQYSSSSTAVV